MRKDVAIIKAIQRHNDYYRDAMVNEGIEVLPPYKDFNLLLRIMREVWFRLHFPCKKIWFNKEIKRIDTDKIIVKDSLIIPEFLTWLRENRPNCEIVLSYDNKVRTTVIKPEDVDKSIKLTTFDRTDAEIYNMELQHPGYMKEYCFSPSEKREPKYDVIFLGRDKGRLNTILELEKQFNDMGLKTNFRICPDREFQLGKSKYYKPYIDYKDYIEMLKETKAHLNIVIDDQISVTQRDMESCFDAVKCITNNKGIKDFELYHPSRFFILGLDDMSKLVEFLNTPFLEIPEDKLKEYC